MYGLGNHTDLAYTLAFASTIKRIVFLNKSIVDTLLLFSKKDYEEHQTDIRVTLTTSSRGLLRRILS